MIDAPLAIGWGLLASFDPALTTIESLAGRSVGMVPGTKWQLDLVNDHMKVVAASGYKNLTLMLQKRRVDAILIDRTAARNFEAELAGATMTKVADVSGYPWIRAGLKHLADEIAAAIRAYRAKGQTFLDDVAADR